MQNTKISSNRSRWEETSLGPIDGLYLALAVPHDSKRPIFCLATMKNGVVVPINTFRITIECGDGGMWEGGFDVHIFEFLCRCAHGSL